MFDWIHAFGDNTSRGDLEADIIAMRMAWEF